MGQTTNSMNLPLTARLYCIQMRRSNFSKDHRDKTEVPDPLVLEDLISYKLNKRRKLAKMITQYRYIFSNISEGTAFLPKYWNIYPYTV